MSVEKQQEAVLPPRGVWGSKAEFILTCVGYAVGLGNVWRFPYLCYQNGGGAFLIPYILMLLLVGFPIFFLELILGQFSSLGPVSVWAISPLFKGVGCAMVATNLLLGLYYIIIVAWAFHFLFASFTSQLPWAACGNPWNTPACITGDEMKDVTNNDTALNLTLAARNLTGSEEFRTPSEEYFYRQVLQVSGGLDEGGTIVWHLALCLLLAWLVVYLVLIKGIKSLGKVVYFMSLFPYVMMTVLVVRGATLDGAADGVAYYLKPDLSKLADFVVWSDAATMVFYSLSACTGGLIAMSSYNNFNNNCYRDSIIVPTITGFTSLYSGFAIFSVLGFMAHEKGVSIDKVAAQGPGLVFVVYPEAIAQMPLPPVWSVLFFIMLLTLGFSSLFSIVESVFVAVMDEFPTVLRSSFKRQAIFRAVCVVIFYFLTLPMVTQSGFYLFSLTDHFVSGFPLLIIGLIEIGAVGYSYGYQTLAEDVELMIGKKPNLYFHLSWMAVSPAILTACIVAKAVLYEPYSLDDYGIYPDWGQALGWLQVSFILSWIPIVPIIMVWRKSQASAALQQLLKPDSSWGPAHPDDRTGTKYETTPHKKANYETTPHKKANYETTPHKKALSEGDLKNGQQTMAEDHVMGSVSGGSIYSVDSCMAEDKMEYPIPYDNLGFTQL